MATNEPKLAGVIKMTKSHRPVTQPPPHNAAPSLTRHPFLRATLSMGALLAAFALATLTLCMLTAWLTRPLIEKNQQQALVQTLSKVFPHDKFDNDLMASTVVIAGEPLGYKKEITAYIPKLQNRATGLIFTIATHEGYGGTINLLIGTDRQGTLTGVRVLPPHPETPGLGDKIETKKSDWILGFTGRSLQNTPTKKWAVKKDGGTFDSFTGATITPRAVVSSVHQALVFFNEQGRELVRTNNP